MSSRRLENTYGVAFSLLTCNVSKYADPIPKHRKPEAAIEFLFWKPRSAVNFHRRLANFNRHAVLGISTVKR